MVADLTGHFLTEGERTNLVIGRRKRVEGTDVWSGRSYLLRVAAAEAVGLFDGFGSLWSMLKSDVPKEWSGHLLMERRKRID